MTDGSDGFDEGDVVSIGFVAEYIDPMSDESDFAVCLVCGDDDPDLYLQPEAGDPARAVYACRGCVDA